MLTKNFNVYYEGYVIHDFSKCVQHLIKLDEYLFLRENLVFFYY